MAHNMFHRRPILPGQPVEFFTSDPKLAQALGGEGPHDGVVVRLQGDNIVDVEVALAGASWNIAVNGVPPAEVSLTVNELTYAPDASCRWQWPDVPALPAEDAQA